MKFGIALSVALSVAATIFLSAGLTPANATPAAPVNVTYNVTLQDGVSGVSNIMVIQKYANQAGYSYSFLPLMELGPGTSSFSLTLTPTAGNPLLSTLALGRIPGNPSNLNTDHLVILGNFTANEIGISYSSLFPDAIEEEEILIDLESIFVPNSQYPDLYDFAFNYDELGLAVEADSLGMFTALGSSVDAVSFSTGALIGTGVVTAAPASIPEPLSLSLLGAGLLGAFAIRRHNAKA